MQYKKEIEILKLYLKKYDKHKLKKVFVNNNTINLINFATQPLNKKYYIESINVINNSMHSNYTNISSLQIETFENIMDNLVIDNKKATIIEYIRLLSQCVIVILFFKKSMQHEMRITIQAIYEKKFNISNNQMLIYRGQCNCDWKLVPSMLRNLSSNVLIDINYLKNRYDSLGLLSKYIFLIDDNDDINYTFISYMQHACSYSPFIDFTKSNIIGISFALSNTNSFNDFNEKNSSLYTVKVEKKFMLSNENEINSFLKNKFKIIHLNRTTIGFGESIGFYQDDKYNKIEFTTFKTIIDRLTPKYKILNVQTNDRMKYQKGLFLVFYNCICLGDTIFYELNAELDCYKFNINTKDKINYISKIYKNHRYYDPEHLMHPYLYFNE